MNNMNNTNSAHSEGAIFSSHGFPCRFEILGNDLCNENVVIRCVDESSGVDARVPMNVFDAKLLAENIISGDLDTSASFAFEQRQDYGLDDFIGIFNHSAGGDEPNEYGGVSTVSRQLQLSAACTGDWKLEVLVGNGVADKSGQVYLKGMPTTYASTVMSHKMLLCFAHALNIAVYEWCHVQLSAMIREALA